MNPTTPRNSIVGRCLFSLVATVTIFGSLLGLAALFFTWRLKGDARTNLIAAAMFASFYWVSQAMAFLFPGVAWTDPNLLKPGQTLHPVIATQGYLDIALLTLVALAVALSWRSAKKAADSWR